ncbi:Chromatin modification-related protein [Apiospora saccharicola]|uniref:Chromatin modification-related protein n=1 Tax=Apiospora saccharicola TaxID=335842 RepID=A0ABR1W6H6_9PEZI
MRTAKPSQSEAGPSSSTPSSSRRAQPARQARTNPQRSSASALGAASLAGREAHAHDQPIDIFPAITHFTDAITSLPKDLVRHFTLLKEVDAKIFAPEDTLFQLVDVALKSNPPEPRPTTDNASSVAPGSAPMSAQNSSTGFGTNGSLPPAPSADESYNASLYDPANLPRRQLFRHTALKIQEMLVSLEEKNHVISTANEALSKQLSRADDVWPHLESEFSEEAKYGSATHWAYPENRVNKANAAERSRRDGAQAITAAAQALAEEAAARSDARKQAVAARKGQKTQQQQQQQQQHASDADADHDTTKQKHEPAKRAANGSKSRKAAADTNAPVGLGITNGPPVNGNPAPKKRKVDNNKDKATNGAQPMERALSGVFGNNAPKAKTSSPRATPTPEAGAAPASKKRKALPTVNGQAKKRYVLVIFRKHSIVYLTRCSKNGLPSTLSPSLAATSPILPNFTDPKSIARSSPAPAAVATRPVASRARQNSTASNIDNTKLRPASSASNRPNGAAPLAPDATPAQNGSRPPAEVKPMKETHVPVKTEHPKEDTPQPSIATNIALGGSRKNSVAKDDTPPKADSTPVPQQTTTTVVTTKSGRASKPSTPALGAFPDQARSRSARNAQTDKPKRSHKKGASAQATLAAQAVDEDAHSSAHGDDDGEIDANEPRYCYCNGVSYGEMVACDADDCEKEWFHLGCVGLKSAPSSSSKFTVAS